MESKKLFYLVLIFALAFSVAEAQTGRWKNTRDYEPIILTGEMFPDLIDVPIEEIFVYRYDASENSWSQIPFQIDEALDQENHLYSENDGNLDSTEEIVFMARDMGDFASDLIWIDDVDSRQYGRFEVAITDTINNYGQAWVYIYRSATLALDPSMHDYISYVPSSDPEDPGADIVQGTSYAEGHSQGIPDSLVIPMEFGGSGQDILDRQKLHVDLMLHINLGGAEITLPVTIRENFLQEFPPEVIYKDGPVRVLRQVKWTVAIEGMEAKDFSLPLQYYPYSMESGGVSFNVQEKDSVDYIKQSFDLNEHAVGMKFYNPYNTTGIVIDGEPDPDSTIFDDTLDLNEINWFLSTGDQGTFAFLFQLDSLGEEHSVYFEDDSTLTTEEFDTGDFRRYGESGILVQSTESKIVGNLRFAYKSFCLPGNIDPQTGDSLAKNFESPLLVEINPKQFLPVELTSFTAQVNEFNFVELNWTTASESNNYGFEIERKIAEQPDWNKIGFVSGAGTTTSPQSYAFADSTVQLGTYNFRLKQIDFDGGFAYSQVLEVFIQQSGFNGKFAELPETFQLKQNFPNPFNPKTLIRYQIPEISSPVSVELKIFNVLGNEIRTLVQKEQGVGYYQVLWDGKDSRGWNVAAGTYIYRLKAGDFIEARKMLILR